MTQLPLNPNSPDVPPVGPPTWPTPPVWNASPPSAPPDAENYNPPPPWQSPPPPWGSSPPPGPTPLPGPTPPPWQSPPPPWQSMPPGPTPAPWPQSFNSPGSPWFQPMTQRVVQVHTLTRRNWIWILVVSITLSGLIGGTIGALIGSHTKETTTVVEKFFPNQSVIANPTPGDIQAILAQVEPAVVSIDTQVLASGNSNFNGVIDGAGTGMIITPGGEVLTNNHVVAGATVLTVTLFGQNQPLPAHIIGTDPSQDLALIQIDGQHNLPTVRLGNSNAIQVGDSVVAIGNALALQGVPTVTTGIVSATGRSLTAKSDISGVTETLHGLLQTQAPINPGNSGGPLVNSQGQVVGMNTAVAESSSGNAPAQNIGFAITINSIESELASLRAGGSGGTSGGVKESKSAYLGVVITAVTPKLVKQDHLSVSSGVLVQGLSQGGPAQNAGVHVGDVILSIGSAHISSTADVQNALSHYSPGQHVHVVVARGSAQITLNVTLG